MKKIFYQKKKKQIMKIRYYILTPSRLDDMIMERGGQDMRRALL